MMEKHEFYIHSTNGRNKIHVIMWKPMDRMRAILQISHGMAEYVDRYDRLATFLAQHGILVVGSYHLGHGLTARDKNELGYFPTDKGSKTVVDDLYKVTKYIRAQYPWLPMFLLGHSMGSFMARRYLMTYGRHLDGAILMGSGSQPPAALAAGKATAALLSLVKGSHYRSKLLLMLSFGTYNKKISHPESSYDWLSRDSKNVERYMADPYCGFHFTVNGYQILFDVLSFIQDEKHIRKLPADVPLCFMAGTADPVGHYGADIPLFFHCTVHNCPCQY